MAVALCMGASADCSRRAPFAEWRTDTGNGDGRSKAEPGGERPRAHVPGSGHDVRNGEISLKSLTGGAMCGRMLLDTRMTAVDFAETFLKGCNTTPQASYVKT